MTLRLGVVGVGSMGKNHARVYSELRGVELVGVHDADAKQAEKVTSRYGGEAFDDIGDLFSAVDAASIAVPTAHHHEVASKGLEAGCHLLVEKPVAASVPEAREIGREAEEANLTVQVGHVERFNPVFEFLKQRLKHDDVISINARRLGPFSPRVAKDSVALDLMIHDLDIAMALMDGYPEEVAAMGRRWRSGTMDYATAHLRFSNGCIATVEASHLSTEKVRTLEATLPDSYAVADYQEQSLDMYRSGVGGYEESSDGYRSEQVVEKPYINRREPLKEELEHFVDCVTSGSEPEVGIEDGIRALKLAEEIDEVCSRGDA